MKIIQLCLLGVFMAVSACSTFEYAPKKHPADSWSGIEPLQIPYDIRLNQFEKNNLVANPSFEAGREIEATTGDSSRIKGWQTVGRNVSWVDRESADFSAEEVNSGRHAVKIVRKKANELDEAEGVISDYIAVIPGNYYFSYQVKLQNVASNRYRLGVRLFDAVVRRRAISANVTVDIAKGGFIRMGLGGHAQLIRPGKMFQIRLLSRHINVAHKSIRQV